MAELIVIRPEHPFEKRELLAAAVCLGLVAWLLPVGVNYLLAYAMGEEYRGSGVARAVSGFGQPVLVGLGAALLGFIDPRRGWLFAPAIAFAGLFLWIAALVPAVRQSDLDRLAGLVQPLLKILALTVAPAAAAGFVRAAGDDARRGRWQS